MEQTSENQTVQEEIKIDDPKAVLDALERAKADAKRFREEKEKLEADLTSTTDLVAQYSGKLLREKVKSKFESNGIKEPDRFFKFINFNQLDINDDGDLIGFDDQLNEIKAEFPEIFDAKLRVGGQANGAVSTSVNTKISASELQAMKILGKV